MATDATSIRFNHGLGDSVNFCLVAKLHQQNGHKITVTSGESNKHWLWRACEFLEQGNPEKEHPWSHPERFWGDSDLPEWEANKVGANINTLLPPIPRSPEELWRKLCKTEIDVTSAVSPQIMSEADRFLEGLPRPIVAFHAVGTNSQGSKKVDAETQINLQRSLIEAGFSVVVLDFDARAAQIGHERVRGIKPGWGHIDLERLAALFSKIDLLIGVDSGPLHFARLTKLPVLGIFFRGLLPHRVVIPSPRLLCLVPASHRSIWDDRIEQNVGWCFTDYQGDAPTADEIVFATKSILAGKPIGLTSNTAIQRVAGKYLYRRINHDEREMDLLENGTVGNGSGGMERRWTVHEIDGRLHVTLFGEDGATCTLMSDAIGNFHGRWNRHERMPITLQNMNPLPTSRLTSDDHQRELLTKTRWMYRRFGYENPREIEFCPDGRIGIGSGGCERRWDLRNQTLEVFSDGNIVKMRAQLEPDGAFRGRWTDHERMAIEFVPITPEVVDTTSPEFAVSFSYHASHFKGGRQGPEPIDRLDHLRMLIAAIDNVLRDVSAPIIVSAVGQFNPSDDQELALYSELQRRATVICVSPNEDHQHGAMRSIKAAIEAASKLKCQFLIHAAEDILLDPGVIGRMINALKNADYCGSNWGDTQSLNTQVFGCRVARFISAETGKCILEPEALGSMICEHYLHQVMKSAGLKGEIVEEFQHDPRYFHTHCPTAFKAECLNRGLNWVQGECEAISAILDRQNTDKNSIHSYGDVYDEILADRRHEIAKVLEIGIATGGSLRAWSEAFPAATIHGIDVNPALMVENVSRVTSHNIDVKDVPRLLEMASSNGPFQLIVDDGSHHIADQLLAYHVLRPHLADDGIYVIEDIQNEESLKQLARLPGAKVFDRRAKKGRYDDLVVVIDLKANAA